MREGSESETGAVSEPLSRKKNMFSQISDTASS